MRAIVIASTLAVAATFALLGTHSTAIVSYYRDNLTTASFVLWLACLVVATLGPILCSILFWHLAQRTRFGWVFHLLLIPTLFLIVRGCLELMLFAAHEPHSETLTGWATDPAFLLLLSCPIVYFLALCAAWIHKIVQSSRAYRRTASLPLDASLFEEGGEPLYAVLAAHWTKSEDSYYPPDEPITYMEALAARYSLRLPEDFRSYLLHAAPREGFSDEIGIAWWPVRDIKSILDECPDNSIGRSSIEIETEIDTYLVFADYMMWCSAWAICCSDGPNRGRIVAIGGPDIFVANSFKDFLKLALTDGSQIHPGTAKPIQSRGNA